MRIYCMSEYTANDLMTRFQTYGVGFLVGMSELLVRLQTFWSDFGILVRHSTIGPASDSWSSFGLLVWHRTLGSASDSCSGFRLLVWLCLHKVLNNTLVD